MKVATYFSAKNEPVEYYVIYRWDIPHLYKHDPDLNGGRVIEIKPYNNLSTEGAHRDAEEDAAASGYSYTLAGPTVREVLACPNRDIRNETF